MFRCSFTKRSANTTRSRSKFASSFRGRTWTVETARTDLPQHAIGISLRGPLGQREVARWGLQTLKLASKDDDVGAQPSVLQIIVGAGARLSDAAIRILRYLKKNSALPLPVGLLSSIAGLPMPDALQVLDDLCAQGLLTVRLGKSPYSNHYSVTEEGRGAVEWFI